MPKYWRNQIFSHGIFPEVGEKQKTGRENKKKKKANDGNNIDQLRIANTTSCGAHKAAWAKIHVLSALGKILAILSL